jgi:predicted ATPase
MKYLDSFKLVSNIEEIEFFKNQKVTAYPNYYPFEIFPDKELTDITFDPITIFYGDNGSGKSTLLNIIAEKLKLNRGTLFNRSPFFERYLRSCEYKNKKPIPRQSAIITSDEIFDYMLNIRALNQGIDSKREEIFDDYINNKSTDFHFRSMDDYDQLKKTNEARRKTKSQYARERLNHNVVERSNGESALSFFQQKIQDNQLYLLDEPENSLSPAKQQELVKFLADSERFFGCQFIIATHSPFVLSLKYAKIYDLDTTPVVTKKWNQLPEVKVYAEFFKEHQDEFK